MVWVDEMNLAVNLDGGRRPSSHRPMQNEPESLTSSDMPLSLTSFVNPSTTRRAPFIWQELPTQITTSVKPFPPLAEK